MSPPDERALSQKTRRNWPDSGDYRRLGDIRRKPGPLRRQMACACSGAILSLCRSGVGFTVETVDPLDTVGIVPRSTLAALHLVY